MAGVVEQLGMSYVNQKKMRIGISVHSLLEHSSYGEVCLGGGDKIRHYVGEIG